VPDLPAILLQHGKMVHHLINNVFAKSWVLNIKTAPLFHVAAHILIPFSAYFCTLVGIKI
jgi:hypothetical protein